MADRWEGSMRENRVKAKMRQGTLALGTAVSLADPAVIELIGLAGFDAAFIDMEHTCLDFGVIEGMVRACELTGITSIVRVPENNPKTILRLLDAGVQGIQVPHIAGVADAVAAVKAVRYAPLGDRGMAGGSRAARYGTVPLNEHLATSNAETLLTLMVEDLRALRELADIAAVPGVDLIAVGPGDMSAALGVTDPRDPRLKETIDGVAATLKTVGKARMAFAMGLAAYPVTVAQLAAMGVAYSNVWPGDVGRLLQSYRRQVQQIGAEVGAK
jgi:2-keto-3-deoxy-L-rhamnonate aldolase RhmA